MSTSRTGSSIRSGTNNRQSRSDLRNRITGVIASLESGAASPAPTQPVRLGLRLGLRKAVAAALQSQDPHALHGLRALLPHLLEGDPALAEALDVQLSEALAGDFQEGGAQ